MNRENKFTFILMFAVGIAWELQGSQMNITAQMVGQLPNLFLLGRPTESTATNPQSLSSNASAIAEQEHEGKQEKMASEIAAHDQQSRITEPIPASVGSSSSSSSQVLVIPQYLYLQTPKQQFAQELFETGKKFLYETDNNEQIALTYLKLAAENGSIEALFELGDYCNLTNNNAEALHYFKLAAEQNYALAQCRLGNCYEKGIGVSANINHAISWYIKAAKQGNILAQEGLKRCNAILQTMLSEILQLVPEALSSSSSSSSSSLTVSKT